MWADEHTIIVTVEQLIKVLESYPPGAKLKISYDSGYGTGACFIVENFRLEGDTLHIEVET